MNIKSIILIVTALVLSTSVYASLIGTEFLLELRYGDRVDNSGIVIVEEGINDVFDMYLGSNFDGPVGYLVDINSSSISIDFYISTHGGTHFNGGEIYNGLYISGAEFNAPSFISSMTFASNAFSFDESRAILIDDHSVVLDFSSISFWDNSSLDINFDQPPAVPIPSAVWLFGSGLIGLIGFARRKA